MKKWFRTVTAGVIFNDCDGLRVAEIEGIF
jgi:CRISPR/Cas system CMR-associated protein Cmr1 (group 7 of RAMP superfamily)